MHIRQNHHIKAQTFPISNDLCAHIVLDCTHAWTKSKRKKKEKKYCQGPHNV